MKPDDPLTEMEMNQARIFAARILSGCIARHGRYHPATFAAYGRAHVIWAGDIRPPSPTDAPEGTVWAKLAHAYTTAQMRAVNSIGWDNKRYRRYWRDREKLLTACEVCGRRVRKVWFAIIGDRRLKCSDCSQREAEPLPL